MEVFLKFDSSSPQNSLFFKPLTAHENNTVIKKTQNTSGPYYYVCLGAGDEVAEHLAATINTIFTDGYFPRE